MGKGKKEKILEMICTEYFGSDKKQNSTPNWNNFSISRKEEIKKIYKELGGVLPDVNYNFRGYDIELPNFIIELDEELHFNRYRRVTLNSSVYNNFFNFEVNKYKNWCIEHEKECIKKGKGQQRWQNSSSDSQFGGSDERGILGELGSSRWKQRALYDLIKDAFSIDFGIPIIRISIYDNYKGLNVADLINNKDKKRLIEYINQRYDQIKQ